VKGKLSYMAPEQVTTRDVDRRADVFALGCVLYEATVGQRPYAGGDALATLYQLLEEPLTPPSARSPGYPPELEKIILRAMERDREARFATAEELGRALERFLLAEKAMVSDARVAELVKKTLSDSIAQRSSAIAEAIREIEEEKTRPRLPSAPGTDAAAPADARSPKAAAPLATPADPTLSGTSLTGPQPKRSQRVVLLAAAGALAVGVGVFALTRPSPVSDVAPPATAPAVMPALPEAPSSATPAAVTTTPIPEASATPVASASVAPPVRTYRKPAVPSKAPPVVTTAKPPEPAQRPGRPVRTLDVDNPFEKKP
jgi:serine/threonine-protein kinase